MLSSCYNWVSWGLERLSNSPGVIELVNDSRWGSNSDLSEVKALFLPLHDIAPSHQPWSQTRLNRTHLAIERERGTQTEPCFSEPQMSILSLTAYARQPLGPWLLVLVSYWSSHRYLSSGKLSFLIQSSRGWSPFVGLLFLWLRPYDLLSDFSSTVHLPD